MYLLFSSPMRHLVRPNLVAYYLARSHAGRLSVSRIFPAQLLWQVQAHGGQEITALAWDHAGEVLASSGEDGMIRLWQAAGGTCLGSCIHTAVDRLHWSSHGTLAAVSGRMISVLPLQAFALAAAA